MSGKQKAITGIVIAVLLIIVAIIYIPMFMKSGIDDSKIKTKKDVMSYLKKEFNRDDFEIDDNMIIKTEESGYSCNQEKYKTPVWTVTDLSTGTKFEVYEVLDRNLNYKKNSLNSPFCLRKKYNTLTKKISS